MSRPSRPSRLSRLALTLAPACLALACGPSEALDDPADDPLEPIATARARISVAEAASSSCSTTSVKGLSEQIVAQANCIEPGAFVPLPGGLGNLSLGGAVFPYLEEPARDAFVDALEAHPGTSMTVNSMLRTVAQQYLLYRWYQQGDCGIGLAAQPGKSNHETGLAVDLSQYNTWKPHLAAVGFSWLGANDPVHFDYAGPGAVSYLGTDVLAFQQLWNKNHPEDLIAEDGSYGPQTEARLVASPAEGFPVPPSCDVAPTTPDVHLSASVVGGLDAFSDGPSEGVSDLFAPGTYELSFLVANQGAGAAGGVTLAIELEGGFVSARDYLIETDVMGGATFVENDANTSPDNPAHGEALPPSFELVLNAFSPGETKRVTLTVSADGSSVERLEPTFARAFVREVNEHYTQSEWGGEVGGDGSQTFGGGRLETSLPLDVYPRARWEWNGARLEGWTAEAGATAVATSEGERGVLELGGLGDRAMLSPELELDAADVPTITLVARGEGEAPIELSFATTLRAFEPDQVFLIERPASGFAELRVDTSSNASFEGTITALRVRVPDGTLVLDALRLGEGSAPGPVGPGQNGVGIDDPAARARGCACRAGDGGGSSGGGPAVALVAALALAARRRRRP
jgi:MYXO-CTERM domain-containing protein